MRVCRTWTNLGGCWEIYPDESIEDLDSARHLASVGSLGPGDGWDVLLRQLLRGCGAGSSGSPCRPKVVTASSDDPLDSLNLGVHRVGGGHCFVQAQGAEQARPSGASLALSVTLSSDEGAMISYFYLNRFKKPLTSPLEVVGRCLKYQRVSPRIQKLYPISTVRDLIHVEHIKSYGPNGCFYDKNCAVFAKTVVRLAANSSAFLAVCCACFHRPAFASDSRWSARDCASSTSLLHRGSDSND